MSSREINMSFLIFILAFLPIIFYNKAGSNPVPGLLQERFDNVNSSPLLILVVETILLLANLYVASSQSIFSLVFHLLE